MDSITHTLMGLTTYAAVNTRDMDPLTRKALFASAVAASQIPDIDIFLQFTKSGSIMYQMWHRGLSHSIFMVPVWTSIIYITCYTIWKRKDKSIMYMALLNVLLHIGSDALNAWGTGLFEPFSSRRVTLGVIPIVDLVVWGLIFSGFLFAKVNKAYPSYKVWRTVWILILLHVSVQGVQGYIIHQEAKLQYEKTALSASFKPWNFTVFGKSDNVVTIYDKTIWKEKHIREVMHSKEEADLRPLFEQNPKAEVLMQWSPFVVVVEDDEKLGIYDPRFFRKGQSFLYEYIDKN
jgi:inner membrane protein